MAELLVKAVDATHPIPEEDTVWCYKRGDIFGVAPNGWDWGWLELKPPAEGGKFVVIKITDVTRQQVLDWVLNHWECEIDGLDFDPGFGTLRRRRVRIDADLLPLAVRQALNTTGQFTTTWGQIREYVRNKQTNETAAGIAIDASPAERDV